MAFEKIETTIIKDFGQKAQISPTNAPVGSSGIVVRNFDKIHTTIIARATYIGNNTIKYTVFDALAQKSLPIPNILPKKGDKVILNYLYNRGLIIAPSRQIYQKIVSSHTEIEWLHPDLFASQLSKDKNPTPSQEDFKKFCNTYSAGILYFALGNEGIFIDCYSFLQRHKKL
jgi:hypothetical protein